MARTAMAVVIAVVAGCSGSEYLASDAGTDTGSHCHPSDAAAPVDAGYAYCSQLAFEGPPNFFPAGPRPGAIETADVDGDGRLDLIVADTGSNSLGVLQNAGAGQFAPRVTVAAGGTPSRVVAADADRDGTLDLLVAHSDNNTVSVLLGRGDGTFASGPDIIAGAQFPSTDSLLVGDLDNDGDVDLVIAQSGIGSFAVALGKRNGTFATTTHTPILHSSSSSATPPALPGGGILESRHPHRRQAQGALFPGLGTGAFGSERDMGGDVAVVAAGDVAAVAHADFDGNGTLDLAFPGGWCPILLFGDGTGAFSKTRGQGSGIATSISNSSNTVPGHLLALGDINADGRPDALAPSVDGAILSSLLVCLYTGDFYANGEPIWALAAYPKELGEASLAVADLDGDSRLDVAVASRDEDSVQVMLQTSRGTLATPQIYKAGAGPIAAGDFNRDGLTDLVVSSAFWYSTFLSQGGGTFDSDEFRSPWFDGTGAAVSDFDADGNLDLFIGARIAEFRQPYFESEPATLRRGLGDGTFPIPNAATYPIIVPGGTGAGEEGDCD